MFGRGVKEPGRSEEWLERMAKARSVVKKGCGERKIVDIVLVLNESQHVELGEVKREDSIT